MGKINYVVSYPKSGATWFRFLMYHLFHESFHTSKDVENFYPKIGADNEKIAAKLNSGQTFFVKSHYAYSPSIKFYNSIAHVIYLIRNPFNCMKSRLDYYKYSNVKWVDSKIRRQRYLDEFFAESNLTPDKTGDNMHGGWNFHVCSWLGGNRQIPLIVIRYEDLIDNCEEVLLNLCQVLELPCDQESIRRACEYSSFDNLKLIEDREMDTKASGMFFEQNRETAYSKKDNIRFVMKGKSRDFYKQLSLRHKIDGIKAFENGLRLGGYIDILNRLDYLLQLDRETN